MIHVGDCREIMRTLDEESVQCVVTSPPYFGLRDYGVDGQIGLEPRHDCLGWATGDPCGACFVCAQVAVFREVRRVLRADGTCWVNLGDSYCSGTGGNRLPTTTAGARVPAGWANRAQPQRLRPQPGIKTKDLMGMPWRVALALQTDGWWLRQDIIWAKPNPMPESVRDRCTKSHEYLFLLAKSERYYFDAEAIAEHLAPASIERLSQRSLGMQRGSDRVPCKTNGAMKAVGSLRNSFARETKDSAGEHGQKPQFRADREPVDYSGTRNKRSVWPIPTQPMKEAHFATFPEALVEPCILAGTKPGDLVLDPFMGSGTVAIVAERLGRRWVGCELNPAYVAIAEKRMRGRTAGLELGASA